MPNADVLVQVPAPEALQELNITTVRPAARQQGNVRLEFCLSQFTESDLFIGWVLLPLFHPLPNRFVSSMGHIDRH
jgi:hypothetical protein